MGRKGTIPIVLAALLAFAMPAAAQVTIPYSFTFETTIDQDQVNSNFTTLGNAALNRTGGTLTGALTSSGGSLAGTFTGTPTMSGAWTVSGAWTFSAAQSFTGNVTLGDAAADTITVTGAFANSSLRVFDTNASHALVIKPGSDITAERILTLTTGDAARTVTLSGDPTLNDWFNQSVKTTATPTFGATTITGLLDASGAAAGQVKFPATQNASANANTLDDYEEGDWLPVIGGSGGTSGQTYATQTGKYTKVGRKVTVTGFVQLSAKGTITTNVQLQGLPFAVATDGYATLSAIRWISTTTSFVYLTAQAEPGTSAATFYAATAASASLSVIATADVGNATGLTFEMSYITN